MDIALFRSIRTKTIAAMAILFLSLFVAIVLILRIILLNNLQKLEVQNVSERMNRAKIGIEFERSDLKKTATDWAEWDDTYQFVEDGNQEFIDSNPGASFFANLRLDAMVYINQAGQFVYAQQLSEDATALEPVPDATRVAIEQLIGDNPDALCAWH